MVTRSEVVAEARTWLETPYRHQGRLKGVAVDCAGLVLGVVRALGMECRDVEGYAKRPDGTLKDIVYSQTLPVEPGCEAAGDVVVFHWDNDPVHLAILTSKDSIIHAFAINREVCEHGINERWRRQIAAFRKIPGVE